MKVYTFSEATQQLAAVLDCARKDGEVRIARRDGRVFVIQLVRNAKSPLAVEGVDLGTTREELLDIRLDTDKFFMPTKAAKASAGRVPRELGSCTWIKTPSGSLRISN